MELQERKSSRSSSDGESASSTGETPVAATLSKTSFDEGGTVRRNATATLNQISTDMQLSAALSGVVPVPDDTFTVTQAINAIGFGKFQILLSIVVGLCWMADSMEMMILSVLPMSMTCQWGIGRYRQALLTTVVFIGMMVSSAFWGKISDRFGRKTALIISGSFLFFYAFLSSFAPTYPWILCLRFMVGFNIGCVPQSVTLYAEFLPNKQRGKCVVLLDCFWALGACLEVVLAMAVMPSLGWRWLLGLSSLPSLIFLFAASWLPESPRYLAASGQSDRALDTLTRVANSNGKSMLLGRLIVDDCNWMSRGRLTDLLSKELRRTTLLLWIIWFVASFSYYGVVLMSTEFFETAQPCSVDNKFEQTCSAQCNPLKLSDYTELLWTTLAEFPGIMVSLLLIERIGRKYTMAIEFIGFSMVLCLMLWCTADRTVMTFILFLARALGSGLFQTAYVYTPEVYPTVLRSVGVGSCSGVARAGAMLTPYIAQVLFPRSYTTGVTIYIICTVLATISCFLLPVETKGRELKDQN